MGHTVSNTADGPLAKGAQRLARHRAVVPALLRESRRLQHGPSGMGRAAVHDSDQRRSDGDHEIRARHVCSRNSAWM